MPVSAGDEEGDIFLDASGIPIENEKLTDFDVNIVVQDQTQLHNSRHEYNKLPSKIASKMYRIVLRAQEKELHEMCRESMLSDSVSKEEIQKFLTLSQKWRVTVKAIKSIDEYSPNLNMVEVWLIGLRRIFWKANSMVWNLHQYENLEYYYEEFERISTEYDRFEWVKYQIVNLYSKVIGEDEEKNRKALNDLSKEESPLVRLGYYSILIESINADSKLFGSFSAALKNEPNDYVKHSVLNLIHRRHVNVSIERIKEWFL